MNFKKNASLILAIALVFSLSSQVVFAENSRSPFTDVSTTHWAFPDIVIAYNDGVMTGVFYDEATGERKFGPINPLTMAEWTVMLVRAWYADELAATNIPEENWFNREAAILHQHGIYGVLGTNTTVEMYTSATRSQMAVMIANLLEDKGITVSDSDIAAAKSQIPDIDTLPGAYQRAAAICYSLGILRGKDEGKFCGDLNMQRCEAAAVYVRVKTKITDFENGSGTPAPTPSSVVGTMSKDMDINKKRLGT